MNRLDVYNLMVTGEITQEQAAATFGFTEKDLGFRMTRWGHRLPLLLATLDKIATDKMSREEAAEVLQISVRQVNKLQTTWNVSRPLKTYLVDKAVTQIKWEMLKKFAIDFIAGTMTFEQAAEGAGCSDRQMRRWVAELLVKHYEMPYKDLKTLSMNRRKRLADEIETAEHLELSKQNVLRAIADGRLSVQEEALNRVLSKRVIHDRRRAQSV